MRIHKEGIVIILLLFTVLLIINLVFFKYAKYPVIQYMFTVFSVILFSLVLWFFRNPSREMTTAPFVINCPADGEIVVVEEVLENEYFKDNRIQVSIFMSPLNVHVNRYPISGTVSYVKYHPGKYLVAWHPKSSELNERSTIVVRDENGKEILVRQIAGAVARRIVTYSIVGDAAIQGEELGFIKFGSRVDLFLPLGSRIDVVVGQKVKANRTVIGSLKQD